MYLEMTNGLNVSNAAFYGLNQTVDLTRRIQGETEWRNNVERRR